MRTLEQEPQAQPSREGWLKTVWRGIEAGLAQKRKEQREAKLANLLPNRVEEFRYLFKQRAAEGQEVITVGGTDISLTQIREDKSFEIKLDTSRQDDNVLAIKLFYFDYYDDDDESSWVEAELWEPGEREHTMNCLKFPGSSLEPTLGINRVWDDLNTAYRLLEAA